MTKTLKYLGLTLMFMVHQHGAGKFRCPKCKSKHVDADDVNGKMFHYCLECGYEEKP